MAAIVGRHTSWLGGATPACTASVTVRSRKKPARRVRGPGPARSCTPRRRDPSGAESMEPSRRGRALDLGVAVLACRGLEHAVDDVLGELADLDVAIVGDAHEEGEGTVAVDLVPLHEDADGGADVLPTVDCLA